MKGLFAGSKASLAGVETGEEMDHASVTGVKAA